MVWQGGSQYGQRSIMDQVGEYLRCSRQNQRMFRNPQVRPALTNWHRNQKEQI
jgi:hypothetical protein